MIGKRTWLCLAIACLLATALIAQVSSQVIQSPELEDFLRQAKIVQSKGIGEGVTLPIKLTLELNAVTRFGVFKSIDVSKPLQVFDGGAIETNFQDTWKTEIAAYEVDKLVGLGMVPVTVEKVFEGKRGSVQFWADSMMTEADRVEKKMPVPPQNIAKWNQLVQKEKLWDNLVYNTDRHLNNLMITKDWEIILIDHSRSFRVFKTLQQPKTLTRFSKSLLEGLQRLNTQNLTEKTGKYLSQSQIEALLKRRDLILDLAKKMVAEQGDGILYP